MLNLFKRNIEIERKFLVSSFPEDLFLLESLLIHQSYINADQETRVRSVIYEDGSSSYNVTLKSNGLLSRAELTESITEKEFDKLVTSINLKPIQKEYRKYILEDGNILEVSKVDDTFYYAEVEFNSEKRAVKWEPTGALKRIMLEDVTYKEEYKMKNYWKKTRLKE